MKVRNGTPDFSEPSLCESCAYARVTRGEAPSEMVVVCTASYSAPQIVRFKVVDCSAYFHRAKVPYSKMEEIAWFVDVDHKTNNVGFVSPHERQANGPQPIRIRYGA